MDPKDVGISEKWYSAARYDSTMPVPGCWNANGAGTESDNLFHKFEGPAWYHRQITLPKGWKDKAIWLEFGGVHRTADVWVNGQSVGRHVAYVTPFKFDISDYVAHDAKADISVRVDGRRNGDIDPLYGCFDLMDMGDLDWGGMYRGVQLRATEAAWIENLHVIPHVAERTAEVTVEVGGPIAQPYDIAVEVIGAQGELAGNGKAGISHAEASPTISVPIADAKLWSPQHPHLYTVKATLYRGGEQIDSKSDRFGMREIGKVGKGFVLNGQPIFLRGYGDDCIFPNTIAPPVDKHYYLRRFEVAKSYGFNYIRHHSWFPPKEYLDAADEMGILLQPEFPIAYDAFFDASTPEKKQLYLDSWREVIRANWNHPCIADWCMGNEIGSQHELSREMYRIAKEIDATRMVIDTDGVWIRTVGDPMRPTLDFLTPVFDEHPRWGFNDNKYPLDLKATKPILVHEMGNFATLPSLTQIDLFTNGVRPYWLYTLRDLVTKQGVEQEYESWVAKSNKLQAVVLKVNTEAARRSPDISGYQQWLLQDYWNGSNGVLDTFYRPKGITAAQYRKFNSPTVLLMDCARRNYWAGETVEITILASRYEDQPSQDAMLTWKLTCDGKVCADGEESGLSVKSDGVKTLRTIYVEMPNLANAHRLSLSASLTDQNGRSSNDWDFWVYPKQMIAANQKRICCAGLQEVRDTFPGMSGAEDLAGCQLLITAQVTPEQLAYLVNGGRALLMNAGEAFPSTYSSFRPCWWLGDRENESKNTGTVIDKTHPALRGFPNDGWCDLNFANLLNKSTAVLMDDLPAKIPPIIRCLDVHGELRNKAYLFEVKVGQGKLLSTSMNFANGLQMKDPAAIYLLDGLMKYAMGADFAPTSSLPASYRKP
jgi:beta-galactosidase